MTTYAEQTVADLYNALDHCAEADRYPTLIALSDALRESGRDGEADGIAWAARAGKWSSSNGWNARQLGWDMFWRLADADDGYEPSACFRRLARAWAELTAAGIDPLTGDQEVRT